MSKLWIVHRHTRRRAALARLAGLAPSEVEDGPPSSAAFGEAAAPTALLLGLEDDFEPELEFLHRHRAALEGVRRLFVVQPGDVDEAARLTGARPDEIVAGAPDPRRLRAFVLSARAHRRAEPLAARRDRERIARRFSTWFGDLDLPGLMRTLDPSLAAWPLLVRGVPGSGRSLVARYVERYRHTTAPGPTLRVDARTLVDLEALDERRQSREARAERPVTTIWIDELDALPPSVQRGLAEWIRLGVGPDGPSPSDLRWVATAGPPGLHDRLEPLLLGAFAPLTVAVPALADRPGALAPFAERVVAEWAERAGGLPRTLSDDALDALEAHAWTGDRAAVEALLRSALAATARETILASDLATTAEDGSLEEAAGAEGADDARAEDDPIGPERFARAPVVGPTDAPAPPPPSDEDHRSSSEALGVEEDDAWEEDGDETYDEEEDETYDDAYDEDEDEDEEPYDDEEAYDENGTPIVDAAPGDETGLLEAAFLEGLEPPAGDAAPSVEDEGDLASGTTGGDALTPEGDVSSDLASESFRIAASGRTPDGEGGDPRWRRLARSLSHEIRNPLVSIKTFTELLPEHFEDDSFRERFTELVGRDVAHIDEVIGRLARAAEGDETKPATVDVSAMIERLLDERRETVGERRLLVLRELERDAPFAWAEPTGLEGALAGLIDRALASLPERGDLFIATRHIDRGPDGTPRLRVLLRHHHPELGGGDRSGVADVGAATNAIEYVLAETVVESAGGQLTIDTTDARETLILVDLRTPA